jgi:3-hydroxyacyl-CoA dehydrogenase
MSPVKPIQRIAIIGTGVIGASWAAQFLAKGFDVIAADPARNAEADLRKYIDNAWGALAAQGLAPGASRDRLQFADDAQHAVSSADFVQENGPERPDFKTKLFADLDEAAPAHAILASSSSGLTMSIIQSGCKRPERCVIGHPFNPPHMIPLVEVVGGAKTSPEAVERAMQFYASIGKKPIRLRKEVVGHVANRLQAALLREVFYLIEQGVVDVSDADTAVSWGPGLRWGIMGPNLLFHLAGGAGGIGHALDHLAGPMAGWWKDLGTQSEITPTVKKMLIEGVVKETEGRTIEQLAAQRDWMLLQLLDVRASGGMAQGAANVIEPPGRLFYLDISGGYVMSMRPDGSDRKAIVRGLRRIPDGIAVDAAHGHVYWTNMGRPDLNNGSIQRADLNGMNLTTIIPEGGTFTPKQLKLDAKNGKLYWSDREGMRVMRSNLDGSRIETLIVAGVGDTDRLDQRNWCVGIAVDADRGHFYWTQKGADNADQGRIFRANIEMPKGEDPAHRTDIELLYNGLPEPIDLDLDLRDRMIYWSDRGNGPRGNSINRAPMDAPPKARYQPEVLLGDLNEAMGLSLDLQGRRMFFADLGGSVYCAKMDGSEKKTLSIAQGNFTGIDYVPASPSAA